MGSGAASLGVCLRSQGKAGPVQPSGALDLYSHLWRGPYVNPLTTQGNQAAGMWGERAGGLGASSRKARPGDSSLLSPLDLNMA